MQPATTPTSMLERITAGVDSLDQVLDGGLPRYSLVFVAGLPGSGKTILSQQALFANACLGQTGLYLSTIEDIRTGAEDAVADGILYLYGTEEAQQQKRSAQGEGQ